MMESEKVRERSAQLKQALGQVGVKPSFARWNADGTRSFLFGDNELHDERFISVRVLVDDFTIVVGEDVGSSSVRLVEVAGVVELIARKLDELGWPKS